ncbi:MAG TPA: RraA family protein [bacterium]|nr:RraA family protein [bacterium]
MPRRLSTEELQALGRLSTPTLSNAIETFDVRPHNEGFAGPEIRAVFPELGAMVGYACTLRVAADRPAPAGAGGVPLPYWSYVAGSPGPKVVVVQDLDAEPVGAFWGEVNANVHTGLGAVGTVTHGGVRDLDEMRQVGFRVFASAVLVSHAYVHVVDFGGPVQIGRLTVSPGDLICADQHGVLVVPPEIAPELGRVASEIERLEREIINCARGPAFTPERLAEVWTSAVSRWPVPGRRGAAPEAP